VSDDHIAAGSLFHDAGHAADVWLEVMAESIMTHRLRTEVSGWILSPQNLIGAVLS